MSTYLFAWAIGKFVNLKGTTNRGLKIGVYTSNYSTEELGWALECAMKAIEYFETIFGINYTLPKLDLLSIPNFESGAMENWGLITFREVALLSSKNNDIRSKIYIAKVIIHELAHQWFGNLVTLNDWKNLWLNEGFASFFAFDVLEKIFSNKFKQIGFFKNLTKENLTIKALRNDGKSVVRALTPNHLDDTKINQIFDSVSYAKGGSVLYSLKHYIGDRTFYKFLNVYLNKNQFNNVSFEVLLNNFIEFYRLELKDKELKCPLDEEINNIAKFLKDIVYKEGVPVLSYKINIWPNNEVSITFKQERFYILKTNKNNEVNTIINTQKDDKTIDETNTYIKGIDLWHIPIEITFYFYNGESITKKIIMPNTRIFIYSKKFNNNIKFVLINKTGSLYYMPKFFTLNKLQLNHILQIKNINLLRSYLNYIPIWLDARQLSVTSLSTLTHNLTNSFLEIEYKDDNKYVEVLVELVKLHKLIDSRILNYLTMHLPGSEETLKKLKLKMSKQYKNIQKGINKYFEGYGTMDSLPIEEQAYIISIQFTIIGALISTNDIETLGKYALKFYNNNYVPNERAFVLASVVKSGDQKETYNKFIEILKNQSTPPMKRVEILFLLGAFEDETLMIKTIDIALFEKRFIRNQDRRYIFLGLVRNVRSTEKALKAIKNNWGYLTELYKGTSILGKFVSLFGNSSRKETIKVIKELFGKDKSLEIALNDAVEQIKINYAYNSFNKELLETNDK